MKPHIFRFVISGILAFALLTYVAWFLLYRDTSVYAPRFSQRAFERVHAGMSQAEVRQLLGEPVVVQGRVWYYSKSSNSGVYHAKIVEFSDRLVVSRKVSYLIHD